MNIHILDEYTYIHKVFRSIIYHLNINKECTFII